MVKNKNGMIVIFVVVILGMISILYTSIYILIGIEGRIYGSLENRTRAYYLAESGGQAGIAMINEGSIVTPFTSAKPLFYEYKGDNWYEGTVVNSTPPNTYTITTIGHYENTKRIVEIVVTKDDDGISIDSWREIN